MTVSRVRIGSAESLLIGLARTVTGCCQANALAAGLGTSVFRGGPTVDVGQSSNVMAAFAPGAYCGAVGLTLENASGQPAWGSSVISGRVSAAAGKGETRRPRIGGSESTI